MTDKLLPCPFCGGEAIVRGSIVTYDHVACRKCNSAMIGDTKEEAIEKWNTRPNPWHTETPTEEGWYLVQTKGYWVVLFFDSILGWVEKKEAPYIEAWQKIEPYEASK